MAGGSNCVGSDHPRICFHNVLPRCWRLAFGEYQVPRHIANISSEWHRYVKSKVNRVSMWFSLDDWACGGSIYAMLVSPGEHLLLALQRNDSRGALRDLMCDHSSPVQQCFRTYWEMFTQPAEHLKASVVQYQPRGLRFVVA